MKLQKDRVQRAVGMEMPGMWFVQHVPGNYIHFPLHLTLSIFFGILCNLLNDNHLMQANISLRSMSFSITLIKL